MKEKTKQQVDAEIKALEACKAYVPRKNFFGDDNHRNIDLQIEELRFGIDDTAVEWEEFSEAEQSSILEARDWQDGQIEEAPSSGWDNFKPKSSAKPMGVRKGKR